jgi:hypothetical protein
LSTSALPESDPSTAFHCYFAGSINAPAFVSSGQGPATFSDEMSGQHIVGELLSPGNEWTGSLRGRTIELKFSSAAVCGNPQDPYLPDWDGVPLALTIDSSVVPAVFGG